MFCVSVELQKHEWKFGRTRNAVGTRAEGECFHISQTSLTRYKHGEHVFYCFRKHCDDTKENNLLTLVIKM